MSTPVLVLSIIHLVISVTIIAIIAIQSGKDNGLAGIFGGEDTYLAKNKAKTLDAKLSKVTVWLAIAFLVLTLVITLMS